MQWLTRSLLGRLIIIVVMIDGLAAALCGLVIVVQARSATSIEIMSAMRVAELLVTDTIGLMRDAPASLVLQTIQRQSMTVRHVRASVADENGAPVLPAGSAPRSSDTAFETHAPEPFTRLIAPVPIVKTVPLLLRNRLVGNVTLTSEPADEIDEAWHYASALLLAGLCLSLAVLLALALTFGRVLAPLTKLAAGLRGLGGRNYAVRLPRPQLHELAVLTDHFNDTACALEAVHKANAALNRKLLTAQDDERRRTALELHDEVGPCLFALDVETASILSLSAKASDGQRVHGHAKEVASLIKQVQLINRRLLDRLRPMGLGRIPLTQCLYRVLVDFERDRPPAIEHEIGPLAESYDPVVDLTVYRCAQEGLFNAVRHAKASKIALKIREVATGGDRGINVLIQDDGCGFRDPPRAGIGISGMRERVEALSGTFGLSSTSNGTTVDIVIPLTRAQAMAEDVERQMA